MNLLKKLFKKDTKEKSYKSTNISFDTFTGVNNEFFYAGSTKINKLIEEGYISNPDVYSVIDTLAEIGSDIPFKVEQKTIDGWELDEDSSLNDLIHTPNTLESEKEFRYNSINYLLTSGEIFHKKIISSFDIVTELELLEPNLVDLLLDINGDVTRYEYLRNNTTQINYTLDDVIHSKYLNPSINGLESKRGLSPLQAAYNAIISSNNRALASASMLKNGGAANLISSGSELTMSDAEREDVQKSFQKRVGGADKFGKNVTTTANVNVNGLGMSSVQMQMLDGIVIDRRTICNVFKVDSSIFNDKDASTYNNIQSVNKSIYTRAVIPTNNKIISGYNSIIPAYNLLENKELRIVQDLDGIDVLKTDQKIEAEKNKINIDSITSVLSSPISTDSKIQTLVNVMGMEEDKAKLIVGTEINQNETI